MTNVQATETNTVTFLSESDDRPIAIGFVRRDVSGLQAPRHAIAVQQHALSLGYKYAYTVRPPMDAADPIGYALGIAAGLGVAAIVVFDLAQVDDQPARVCEDYDLETICPATTWARAAAPRPAETGAV
ncbi:hypothetical protein [Nocardia sp. BMG51109]|uniref:hypothetical protein n=1 Tax=Nocardia sp. BMG51109 TaxID=1056816 RepID=UPI000464DCAF|nr:hypothetical protein [Nocardia sp. BMG51109]